MHTTTSTATERFYYHATTPAALAAIAREGLRPVDGTVSLAHTRAAVAYWQGLLTVPATVVLRVRRTRVRRAEVLYGGEAAASITEQPIAARDLEHLVEGAWLAL